MAASHDDGSHCDNRGNDCYDQRDDSHRSCRTRGANFTGRTGSALRSVGAVSASDTGLALRALRALRSLGTHRTISAHDSRSASSDQQDPRAP